jgi:hypothetical protein
MALTLASLRFLFPVLLGILGFALAWSGWHLYVDHQDLHALIAIERARQVAPAAPAGR